MADKDTTANGTSWLARARAVLRAPFDWVAGLFAPSHGAKQLAFTMAFVGLAAKMAKADGVAVAVETEAFEHSFHVPPEERANVDRIYWLAAQDVAGYEVYAERIARMLADDPPLLRDVFEALFNIAAADGILHEAEERFLMTVANRFGLSARDYQAVRGIFVREQSSPYVVLGVEPTIPDDELKAHYRRLVRDTHPDKLAAEGVPAEFLVLADRKLAAINAAYDEILKQRGQAVIMSPASETTP